MLQLPTRKIELVAEDVSGKRELVAHKKAQDFLEKRNLGDKYIALTFRGARYRNRWNIVDKEGLSEIARQGRWVIGTSVLHCCVDVEQEEQCLRSIVSLENLRRFFTKKLELLGLSIGGVDVEYDEILSVIHVRLDLQGTKAYLEARNGVISYGFDDSKQRFETESIGAWIPYLYGRGVAMDPLYMRCLLVENARREGINPESVLREL